jgi:hypothetical protein
MVTIDDIKKKYPMAFEDIDKETTIKSHESLNQYLKSIMVDGESIERLIWRIIIEREEYKNEVERLRMCSRSTTEPEKDHS